VCGVGDNIEGFDGTKWNEFYSFLTNPNNGI